jgi:hypothetical protein
MALRRLGVAKKWRGREMGFWKAAILGVDLKSWRAIRRSRRNAACRGNIFSYCRVGRRPVVAADVREK